MRILLGQIEQLIKQLSNSTNHIQVSLSLKRSINQDIKAFPVFSKRTETLNTDEPYRKKLDFMRLKCLNTLQSIDHMATKTGLSETLVGSSNDAQSSQTGPSYTSLEPLIDELYIIAESLNKNKGALIAQNNLNPLLFLAQVLAKLSLDFRQHSDHHHHCVKACFSHLELDYADTNSYFANLIKECRSKRVLGLQSFYKTLDDSSQDTFESFTLFKEAQHTITPNSTNSYIISMTEKKEDVFAVLLLAKEAGLINIQKGRVSAAKLDVVPLFETKSALDGATAMMKSLFEDPFYRSYLAKRGNAQEIMLGFSDSNKDVGPLGSHLSIYQLQKNLLDLAKRYKIRLRFFYGRGGTISRGGGPMNKAIQALPLAAIENMKITQQGEMLAFHYLNADIAKRHLEQITCSLFERLLFSKPKKESNLLSKTQNQHLFLELIETSCKHYEALTKESAYFSTFFHQITPIDLMAHMHIGSRPGKRKAQNSGQPTQDYRAISWVFGWMQSRILISGFYGVGEALKQAEQKHGLAILRDWYKNWPFFQTFIQNSQMVLLKADMLIAPQYLQLDPSENAKALFERISDEHLEATEYVLQITKQNTLLENSPKIRDQILRRNPFLDPLNMMQVALLAQWRKQKRPVKETPHSLKNQLIETVNGIAAGIRNYG